MVVAGFFFRCYYVGLVDRPVRWVLLIDIDIVVVRIASEEVAAAATMIWWGQARAK